MYYATILILFIWIPLRHYLASDRFGFPTSEEQLCVAAKGVVPNNTLCNTRVIQSACVIHV